MSEEEPVSTRDTTQTDSKAAMAYLLRLLSQRDYTQRELRDRMTRHGMDDEVQTAALARLEELGLLDERRIAEAHVRGRAHRKGRLALRRDLRARGLRDDVVDSVLGPLDEAQQERAARSILTKEGWRFRTDDTPKNRAKAAAFLNRRGFTSEVVRTVVEDAFPWIDDVDHDA